MPDARSTYPLALVPPALTAALLVPATLDPLSPFGSAPAHLLALLCAAAAAPAAAVLTARHAIADARARNRRLAMAGALTGAATAVSAVVALALARPLLVRTGGAWILLAAGAAAVPALAAFTLLRPLSLFRWGLLAGECVVTVVTVALLGAPRTPDEYLRHAMLSAPGWGPTSLAVLATRRASRWRPDHDERHEARLRAIEAMLAAMIDQGAFAPPHAAWGDDARLVRALVAGGAAASPGMAAGDAARYARIAVSERLAFASSPGARLEPWTRRGVLARAALAETDGLGGGEDTRLRVHAAWSAVAELATALDDPALEREAIAVVRRLFAEAKLDRTHPVLLATYSLERRRLVEAGDVPALIAFFDRLAGEDFPDDLRKRFAREGAFLREHADDGYRPVLQLLRARAIANGGDGDVAAAAAMLERLLGTWPDSSVAAIARAELTALQGAEAP